MNCIKCGSSQVHVIDTRAKGPRRIYRRRDCLACGYRWTTVELPAGDLRRAVDALDEIDANDVPYDYCIMDCPPDLDMGSINALCAADWVIIPVDCDEWACDGMREIVDQIERVQMYYNPHLKIMGALMTKYRRTRYAAEVVHQLNDAGVEMLDTVIRYTIKVSEAKSAHKPLRAYRPDCSAATDYGCLADEVEEIVSRMDTKEG